jgi:hypothetical protein
MDADASLSQAAGALAPAALDTAKQKGPRAALFDKVIHKGYAAGVHTEIV